MVDGLSLSTAEEVGRCKKNVNCLVINPPVIATNGAE